MRMKRLAVSALSATLMTTGLTAAVLTATATPALANDCTPHANGADEVMSRGRALARAQTWINPSIQYNQLWCTSNQNGKYRNDCSGLVSMAWGLQASLVTWQFQSESDPEDFYPGVHPISLHDLRPGDAIVRPGHMELFARWKNPNNRQEGAYVYSFNGPDYTLARSPGGSGSLQGFNSWNDYGAQDRMTSYQAIRFNKMAEDEGTFATTFNADDSLRVLVRGPGNRLHEWRWKQGEQTTWTDLGGPAITGNPTTALAPNGDLQVFARDAVTNHLLHWAYVAGSGWAALGGGAILHEDLGGSIASDPFATSWIDGSLQIYARGSNGSLRRWVWTQTDNWVLTNEDMGGNIAGAPAAITDGNNVLRIVAVGTDGALRHWAYKWGVGWLHSNQVVGGTNLIGDPAVTISQDFALQVFVADSAHNLRHFADISDTSTWEVNNGNLYGSIGASPAVTNSADGTIQIVAAGYTDGRLKLKQFVYLNGEGWRTWQDMGGSVYSTNIAATNGPTGNLQIYARGNDGSYDSLRQWHYDFRTGTGWGQNIKLLDL